MFCFRSDNKGTKSKRFAFVPIIRFDIGTFVLSFRYRWHYCQVGIGRIALSYRPARLHWLTKVVPLESIPGLPKCLKLPSQALNPKLYSKPFKEPRFLGSFNISKFGLWFMCMTENFVQWPKAALRLPPYHSLPDTDNVEGVIYFKTNWSLLKLKFLWCRSWNFFLHQKYLISLH